MSSKIIQVGDSVLRQKAEPVGKYDITSRKIAGVIKRMKIALKKEGFGVAIAAPQIGESLRIFVVAGKVFDSTQKLPPQRSSDLLYAGKTGRQARPFAGAVSAPKDWVFINPELLRTSKSKKEMTEGCLSVRNKYGAVLRHEKASIKALDERGKPLRYNASGLIAQIFQHEVDHLDGILYIDKATAVVDDEDWKELREKQAKKKHD